jgi:hypothetical protein
MVAIGLHMAILELGALDVWPHAHACDLVYD